LYVCKSVSSRVSGSAWHVPALDHAHKWVGPEKLTTAVICDLAVSSRPLTAARRIQRAPKDETATRRASHEIDVAIALRVGKRCQNLTFEVVGLLGRVTFICGQLARKSDV